MACIVLAFSALLATAAASRALHQTPENSTSTDGLTFQHGPFFTPREVALRTQLAGQAAAAANISTQLSSALQQAAASSEVNDIDAAVAINSILQSLLPWDGFSLVQAADGSVVSWPAGSLAGGVTIRPPNAAIAQPLPASKSANSTCCAQLAGIGFATNLPIVVIDTKGSIVPLREDVAATLCSCGASSDIEALAKIKIRGSSSAVQMVKKSFGISIRSSKDDTASSGLDATLLEQQVGKRQEVPFLDMPSASDWALYGDNLDQTLGMRNALAFDVARAMDGYWAPRTQFFELFLVQDGGQLNISHYWGPYLAMEKIEIQRNRLALHKLDLDKQPTDLSGGYVLGYERSLWPDDVRVKPSYWAAAVARHTPEGDAVLSSCPSGDGRNLTYLLHEPSAKNTNAEQQGRGPPSNETQMVAWISSYLGSVEAAVVLDQLPGGNSNSSNQGAWRSLVNEKAFIDYLLSQEIVKNPDFARGSLYMYKDRGGLLMMGPPWDLNEAFGMCCGYPIQGFENQGISNGSSGGSAISPEGWRFNICDEPQRCVEDPIDGISLWWRAVWAREPWFKAAVASRWKELRSGPLSDDFFKQQFTYYMSQLQFAAPRNYERWKSVLASPFFATGQELYSSNVDLLIQWTMQRLAWIDQALSQVLPVSTASSPELTQEEAASVLAGAVDCADRAAAYAASRATQHSIASQTEHLPAIQTSDSLAALRQRLVTAQSGA